MISFLKANFLTIVISLLILAFVVFVIARCVKNKKSGACSCGCNCSECQANCKDK